MIYNESLIIGYINKRKKAESYPHALAQELFPNSLMYDYHKIRIRFLREKQHLIENMSDYLNAF